MNSSPKGVLFDFDGTLADTMEGHYLAWKSALAERGISIDARDFYPAVETVISELQGRKVPMAIVTAGHLDRFDVLLTGDQYKRGKADPEPYLKRANALGLWPEECIAVENAPLGALSAKRANTYCIGICSTVVRDIPAEADEVLDRFEDLKSSTKFGQL